MSSFSVYNRRRRARHEKKHGGSWIPRMIAMGLLVVLFGTLAAILGTVAFSALTVMNMYAEYAKNLPEPERISEQQSTLFKTTKIYDRTGKVILYELFDPAGGNRTNVALDKISPHLINATIALEDKTFWTNEGVDYLGMGRALYNMLRGQPLQGASTLTQQLVKKVLIPERETRSRSNIDLKIQETIMAREISSKYSKEQILEWYLNTIYYGNFAYGIEAAAEAYYGKHARDLTLNEAATLAAIPQYPGLNPIDNPEVAQERRDIALDRMAVEGYITEKEAEAAKQEKIQVFQKRFDIKAPHFVFYVRRYLEDKYGPDAVNKGGWSVITSLDYDMQTKAEEIARNQITKLTEEKRNVTNASIVVMKPSTGEISAMVGSVDYFNRDIDGQVNIAISDRQPGSSFKMFSYLQAFEAGAADGTKLSPASVVYDVRTAFEDPPNPPYVPENYDRKYHGPVRLRTGLASSYNIPAVKVLELVGIRNVLDLAHRMGITTLDKNYGLALTLGGGEVKLLDMTYAYGVLANGGVMAGQPIPEQQRRTGYRKLDPVSVLKVTDADGNVLEEYKQPSTERIVSEQAAYLITDVLSDNAARAPAFGLNSVLKLSRPAAVKTGTTSSWKDNWTLGYTPDYVTGVWVGNADNAEMEHISGITGAAPIWHDVMEYIHSNLPVAEFVEPPNLKRIAVCLASGLLPTAECPQSVREVFIAGNEPTVTDNIWKSFRIFVPNGKLATAFNPPDQVTTAIYPIYPPQAADWVKENNIPQPPTEFDTTYAASAAGGDLAIFEPANYASVKGAVEIKGNAKIPDLREWRLNVGAGLDPAEWLTIGQGGGGVDNGVLATWQTPESGLYTLQLVGIDGAGNAHTATSQVTVDNNPPLVEIINPWDDKQYIMENDEWVSIDADARDNLSMSYVDFWLDDSYLGRTQVSPFTLKWTITMRDALSPSMKAALELPVDSQTLPFISYTAQTRVLEPDGVTVTVSDTLMSATLSKTADRVVAVFPNGFGMIMDSGGYTETHTVQVKAYDTAGNVVESADTRFLVSHKPRPPAEQDEPTGLHLGFDGRQQAILPGSARYGSGGRKKTVLRVTT
ncbi:MAG: transglycosylase domain-containing protein [Anaerolineae bacterium]|nr:transglycosylase domain-containing protein [Anaerolineae bacterium]